MARNININANSLESILSDTISSIDGVQGDISQTYSSLTTLLAEAYGEEADALREQLTTEKELATTLCNTLKKFSESIRFAASEFTELDSTGASKMRTK